MEDAQTFFIPWVHGWDWPLVKAALFSWEYVEFWGLVKLNFVYKTEVWTKLQPANQVQKVCVWCAFNVFKSFFVCWCWILIKTDDLYGQLYGIWSLISLGTSPSWRISHGITESHNWIGRHFKDDLIPTPCLGQGHLPPAQGQNYHQDLSSCSFF